MQRTTQAITVSAMGLVLVATLMGCASSGSTNTPSVKPLSSAAPAPVTVAGPTFNTVNSDGKKITTAIAWSALGTGTPACNTFAKKYPKYAVQFVDITATVTYPIEDAAAGSAPYSINVVSGIPLMMGMTKATVLGGICANNDDVGTAVGGKLLIWKPGTKTTFTAKITLTYVSEKTTKSPNGDFSLAPEKTASIEIADVSAADCAAAATNGFSTTVDTFNGQFCQISHP